MNYTGARNARIRRQNSAYDGSGDADEDGPVQRLAEPTVSELRAMFGGQA